MFLVHLETNMVMPDPAVLIENDISSIDKSRIDIFLDLTKLLIGLAVAIIGGVGVFVVPSINQDKEPPNYVLVVGAVALFGAVMSIFFGHMSFNSVIFMLSKGAFPSQMMVYGLWQYICFLISLIFFGAYISGLVFCS